MFRRSSTETCFLQCALCQTVVRLHADPWGRRSCGTFFAQLIGFQRVSLSVWPLEVCTFSSSTSSAPTRRVPARVSRRLLRYHQVRLLNSWSAEVVIFPVALKKKKKQMKMSMKSKTKRRQRAGRHRHRVGSGGARGPDGATADPLWRAWVWVVCEGKWLHHYRALMLSSEPRRHGCLVFQPHSSSS